MQAIRNRTLASFGAIVATFATVTVAAPVRAETTQQSVSYADLDLTTPHGSATLQRRIRSAANALCGPIEPAFRMQIVACRKAAIANARASLPAVTRLAAR